MNQISDQSTRENFVVKNILIKFFGFFLRGVAEDGYLCCTNLSVKNGEKSFLIDFESKKVIFVRKIEKFFFEKGIKNSENVLKFKSKGCSED